MNPDFIQDYPISKYIGTYPNGRWEFVKDFTGTYNEAIAEAARLQQEQPTTNNEINQFCIWDNR